MYHGCSEKCRVYKIIFMDIDMPIMDGITATREVF
jgi:CheY-like chemotaxis protein